MKRLLVIVAIAALALSACSSPAPTIDTSDATVIDVRTTAEYASGHLKGAQNIDLESGSFQT